VDRSVSTVPGILDPLGVKILGLSIQSSLSSPFGHLWMLVECLGAVTRYVTACHTAEPSWGATSPPDAELPGVACLDGF
jgi:hypothetical protein